MRQPVFELLDGLIADHRRLRPHEQTVVAPVVHDSFWTDRELIREGLRRFSGQLHVVGVDSPTRLSGGPDPILVDAVRATCEAAGVDLAIAVNGGEVQVGDGKAVNEAQAITEAVVAAVLGEDLPRSKLVALAYPTGQLDDRHVALLWNLVVHQVPPFLHGVVETFVPIVIGMVEVSDYCTSSPPTSLRYAIKDHDFHRRSTDSTSMHATISMLSEHRDRPLVLFLGAGGSASARMPAGNTVRDLALASLLGKPVDGETIAEVFFTWLDDHGRLLPGEADMTLAQFSRALTLERVLREEFHRLEVAGRTRAESTTVQYLERECEEATMRTPAARQALRELLAVHPCAIIVTVNFDRQVEHDLDVDHRVYSRPAEFTAAAQHLDRFLAGDRADGVPILKIHGTIEDSDSLVADLDQTVLGLAPEIGAALERIFVPGVMVDWLWVGCSMRDRDVNRWMEGRNGGTELLEHWVDPLPGPGIDWFIETCRRKNAEEMHRVRRDERVVSETADTFLREFAQKLAEQAD